MTRGRYWMEPLKGGHFGLPEETGMSMLWGPAEDGAFPIVLKTSLAVVVLAAMLKEVGDDD